MRAGLGREKGNNANKALTLKSDYVNAYINRGNVLKADNRLEDALSSYDEAIKLNPNNAGAHNNRENALKLLKRFDEALSSIDRVLKLNSDHAGAYNNRGDVFHELGEREQAIKCFQEALLIDSDFPDAHRHLSLLNKYSSDNVEHADRIKLVLKKSEFSDSDKMQFHFALGKIYSDCHQ